MSSAPLFPQPVPVVGCTGEYASGKTLFTVTIDPTHTRVYDVEKSSETYISLGFERVDVPAEMCSRYPNGYKPQQTFEWWRDHVRQIKPGQFRVIVLDPASEIESGLVEWVRNNPAYFGHTTGQYLKMSGLMWGDVKELWKSLLVDLASRCEVFAFTVHMGDVWTGDKPSGKRKPKGKSTLMELASLYLQMERKPDAQGNVPPKPAAIVLKSRLAYTKVSADGEVLIVPALPPRLPVATPAAICQYMLHPPDYAHLHQDERAPEQQMSEEEKANVRLATAEAERDAELFRVDRIQKEEDIRQRIRQRQEAEKDKRPQSPPPQIEPPTNGDGKTTVPSISAVEPSPVPSPSLATAPSPATAPSSPSRQTASFSVHAVTEDQLKTLSILRNALFQHSMTEASAEQKKEAWLKILSRRKVNTALALTQEQADELIVRLRAQLGIATSEGGQAAPDAAEGGTGS